jgi:hypothetical protein
MPEPAADWFFNNRGSYSSTLGGLAGKLMLPKDLSHARINAPAPAPTLIAVSNVNSLRATTVAGGFAGT